MKKLKLNIQMFATGSFNVATKNSNISGYVALSSTSNGSSANSSQVKAILYLRRTNNYTGTPSYTYNFVPTFTIDGQSHSYTISTKISIPNDKSYVKMAEWETTVAHNSDGNKYCEVSVKTTSEGGNSFTVPLTSGGFQLDTIPRYANITTFYLTALSRTEIQVTWDADVSCDELQYSLNGGAWISKGGYPTMVIGGLSAGTQYSVRIRVKRTDSQLWTESGTLYATTISNAYIISANDFNDEQNPYMTYSSPSGTNVTLRLEFSGGIINRQNISPSSNYTFQLTTNERNLLREKATSNTLGVRFVVATLENGNEVVWSWMDKTMTIVNANPSFNNFVFEDIKTNTVALTGNNQNFINKNSKVKVTIPVANKMVALKGSSAKRYDITVGNVTKQVNYSSSSDVSAEFDNIETSTMFVTAIDSRGNKTAITKNANYLYAYNQPSFSVIKAIRQNGVGTVVELSVSGTYSTQNYGNASNTILNIFYSLDNQQTWTDITDKFVFTDGTFTSVAGTILTNFELGQEYYLYFKIIDGGVVNGTNYTLKEVISERLTINSGQPLLDINKTKKSVGINCITQEENIFEVGSISRFNGGIKPVVIPGGEDLNNLLTPNFYVGIDVSLYENVPFTNYGTFALKVIQCAEAENFRQEFYLREKGQEISYSRYYYDGTWGSWKEIGNTAKSKYLGNNPNINALRNPSGVYGIYNCSQAPTLNIGSLEVISYSGDWVLQRFTDIGYGGMWERRFTQGTTWTDWVQRW